MSESARTQFIPDRNWPDDKEVHINAHGGGILFHNGSYYWFGEHKIEGKAGNLAHVGVHVYSSKDLYNWKDEGIALKVSDDPTSDIAKESVIERPKVIYNPKTKKFVMWFHLELKGKGYDAARAAVAISDKPTGPYEYLRSFRLNAGHWPLNVTEADKVNQEELDKIKSKKFGGSPSSETMQAPILARDFQNGQMSRDMTLFVDEDGKAYHICASEENSTLHISELSEDFLSSSGKYVRIFPRRWNEAPAICKAHGKYWLISSDCTGWAPNAARSAVAESIWGPWKELGNPCEGINPHNKLGPELTYGGQSTYILPVNGKKNACIAIFDIWRPEDAITGGYVWLPISFEDDKIKIKWQDKWDLSVF